ncbi:MAG: rhomboid family intramembrane serine protease [Longimicrobiales bacterium]|nr:rhomboid family intramembrane serine protease [Longimicrobiales bacterium]
MYGKSSYGQPTFGFNFRLTPVVKWLLIANVAVFFVTAFLPPVVVDLLAFHPNRLLTQFWGAFTYMFVHGGLGHLFVNMLVLFFFGPPLESRWGGTEFSRFYVVSGLGGVALSFILAPEAAIIGASAACYGVMLAFAMNWPRAPIYIYAIFPVQARYLVGFLFLLNVWSGFSGAGGGVAYFAHLGGLVAAFIYLKADWRPGYLAREARRTTRPRPRRLVVVPPDGRDEGGPPAATLSDPEERKVLDEVDRVLDKISAQGMSSLTREERKLLDEVSRRRRTH